MCVSFENHLTQIRTLQLSQPYGLFVVLAGLQWRSSQALAMHPWFQLFVTHLLVHTMLYPDRLFGPLEKRFQNSWEEAQQKIHPT